MFGQGKKEKTESIFWGVLFAAALLVMLGLTQYLLGVSYQASLDLIKDRGRDALSHLQFHATRHSPDELQAYIERVYRAPETFSYLLIMDVSGKAIAHSNPARRGKTIFRDGIRRVIATKQPVEQIIVRDAGDASSPYHGEKTVNMLVPVLGGDGNVVAIANIGISLAAIERVKSTYIWIVILGGSLCLGLVAAAGVTRHRHRKARQKAEVATLQGEAFKKQLLQMTNEGFWHIGPDGKTLDVNPSMCRILNRSREEILGCSIYDFVDDDNKAVFEREIAARKKGKTGAYEVALQRSDGTNISCMNNATPLYDEQGVRIGSVGLWTDISQLKDAFARMEKAKNEAETANAAKSNFLANMSHELRTPLNAIIGFTDMVRHEVMGPISPPKYLDYVNDIHKSGNHLLGVIGEILDMSKIEAGRYSVHLEDLDVGPVLEEALTMIKGRALDEGVDLSFDLPDDLPMAFADRQATKQVAINLLTNAVKFTPDGGEVKLTAFVVDDVLSIQIVDTGVGMKPNEVERAFLPFTQIEREKGFAHEGTGLGLPLSKKLIEMQGGEIDLKSEGGKGTEVTFTLPLAPSHQLKVKAGEESLGSWFSSMSVGVEAWDRDHRRLLGLIEDFSFLGQENVANEELGKILMALFRFVESHMHAEELAMQAVGFPGYDAHKAKHDKFRAWAKQVEGLRTSPTEQWDANEVADYLKDWWHSHVLKVDMEYKQFFEENRTALEKHLEKGEAA